MRALGYLGIVFVTACDVLFQLPKIPPDVTWQPAAAGPVSIATLVLYEVTNNAGSTAVRPVRAVVTLGTSAILARGLLQLSHTYMLAVVNTMGLPNAATGDLATLEYRSRR